MSVRVANYDSCASWRPYRSEVESRRRLRGPFLLGSMYALAECDFYTQSNQQSLL